MDFFELIQKRRSVRAFHSIPVEAEKLQEILQSMNRAPSGGNLQAFEVYLVESEKQRQALAHAALDQDFIVQAPVCLVFCTHPARAEWRYRQRGANLYTIQDATIACTYAMLAVAALGLGTVWVGAFNDESVRQVIGAPSDQRPVAILPIGYAAEEPRDTPRRPLDELVHREKGS